MPAQINRERAKASAAILRACDAVLGTATCGLAAIASFQAFKGETSIASAALLWGFVALNLIWSQVSLRVDGDLLELLRALVSLPIAVAIYSISQGPFSRLIFPAIAMVVAQALIWGLRTARPYVGSALTLLYAGALLVAGIWFFPGTFITNLTTSVSVAVAGLVVSLVGGYLGKSLRGMEVAVDDRLQAKERLDNVLNCASALIVTLDRDGRIDFVNHLPPHLQTRSIIGTLWLDLLPRSEHDALAARLQRVLAGGASEHYDIGITTPDRKVQWYSSHMAALSSRGAIVGVVITSEDVTELRRTQTEFLAAQKMAAIGTLASGMAHEINTPIQFISDSLNFLRDANASMNEVLEALEQIARVCSAGAPAPDIQHAIEQAARIKKNVDWAFLLENVPNAFSNSAEGLERVSTIVRSMKEYAHAADPNETGADINHAIENTLTIARNEYKFVADIERDFAETLPPVICHINDINQVILNLIVNAAHAIGDVVANTGEKGRITVRTRQEGDDVIIAVADTGSGIPENIRHRIFEPFFTTKEVGRGSGQGLALAWSIVKDKHGGQLTFDSEVGRGTTFYVRLPVSAKHERSEAAAA